MMALPVLPLPTTPADPGLPSAGPARPGFAEALGSAVGRRQADVHPAPCRSCEGPAPAQESEPADLSGTGAPGEQGAVPVVDDAADEAVFCPDCSPPGPPPSVLLPDSAQLPTGATDTPPAVPPTDVMPPAIGRAAASPPAVGLADANPPAVGLTGAAPPAVGISATPPPAALVAVERAAAPVFDSAPVGAESTLPESAVPATATSPMAPEAATPGAGRVSTGDAVSASARFVARVERVVEQLQAAGPPRSMVVDLADGSGSRITVSLRGSSVHITFSAAVADEASGWMTDLHRSLAGRGLELEGDGPGWSERRHQQGAGRRNGEQPPDGPRWRWPPPPDDSGGLHGSDRSH